MNGNTTMYDVAPNAPELDLSACMCAETRHTARELQTELTGTLVTKIELCGDTITITRENSMDWGAIQTTYRKAFDCLHNAHYSRVHYAGKENQDVFRRHTN